MTEFKKGQRVRCVRDYDPGRQFTAGNIYTLREDSDGSQFEVEADDTGDKNGHNKHYFEAVDEPSVSDVRAEQLDRLKAVRIEFDRMAFTERKAAIAYLTAHFNLT